MNVWVTPSGRDVGATQGLSFLKLLMYTFVKDILALPLATKVEILLNHKRNHIHFISTRN